MRAQRTALLRITHGSPSKREASYNHSRKQGFPAPAHHICAYLRSSRQGAFCGHSAMPNAALFTPVAPLHENLFIENIFVIAAVYFSESELPRAIMLRLRRREVSAYVMPKAPAGLRRMRELRNCHFSGNFVTETALFIGAVEINTLSGIYAVQWVVSQYHGNSFRQFEKNFVNYLTR